MHNFGIFFPNNLDNWNFYSIFAADFGKFIITTYLKTATGYHTLAHLSASFIGFRSYAIANEIWRKGTKRKWIYQIFLKYFYKKH